MKPNYLIIPILVIAVSAIGSSFTQGGMEWYNLIIRKPEWTPAGGFIGIVWTILYALAAVSLLSVWNLKTKEMQRSLEVEYGTRRKRALAGFGANALLNIAWCFAFFTLHLVFPAIFVAALLAASVAYIAVNAFPFSKTAAYVLLPYFLWVCFATYLNYTIYLLN